MTMLSPVRLISLILCILIPLSFTGQDYRYIPETQGELIQTKYYCADYSTAHKQANWVYYMLTRTHTSGDTPRAKRFRDCQSGSITSASHKDYLNSGYDRGHLCPAADMKLSKEAMDATFLMWNISPQESSFNSGRWADLESLVRSYVRDDTDTLYVVTGPVFINNKGSIGKNEVTVPGLFYKVIYCPKRGGIGFLLPNKKIKTPLTSWQVSISLIEVLTGIDFFPQLPTQKQTEIESQMTWWK